MTLSIEGSRNYSATVIRVPKVRKAPNSDNLYILEALGMSCLVDSSWIAREGELAVIFPAEVQLNETYCAINNLFRDADLNVNTGETGYLDPNRRVRALKLRGNISNGLVMPLDSLNGMGLAAEVDEGDVFDKINDFILCQKYVVPVKTSSAQNRADSKIKKAFKRVDSTYLPEHLETGQWLREEGSVDPHEEIIISQKLHGTSVRLANTVVRRQLRWYERALQKCGIKIADHEYDLVAGSRKAIKDPNNPNQEHFYGQ